MMIVCRKNRVEGSRTVNCYPWIRDLQTIYMKGWAMVKQRAFVTIPLDLGIHITVHIFHTL